MQVVRLKKMELNATIKSVLSDHFLILKICSLKKIKGIESDLRFLFERAWYAKHGTIPKTEVGNRNDILVDFEGTKAWLEFKCYDGVLSVNDTQEKIRSDLRKLSSITDTSEKYFVYFGLYGKFQSPNFSGALCLPKRLNEISEEIKKIASMARELDLNTKEELVIKLLDDRMIYCAWFKIT